MHFEGNDLYDAKIFTSKKKTERSIVDLNKAGDVFEIGLHNGQIDITYLRILVVVDRLKGLVPKRFISLIEVRFFSRTELKKTFIEVLIYIISLRCKIHIS